MKNLEFNFDFLGKRKLAFFVSVVLLVASIALLATRGLNFGIDFTGGTVIEVGYPQAVELDRVRGALDEAGFDDAAVQHFGTAREVMVRLPPIEGVDNAALSNQVLRALQDDTEGVQLRRVEFVGPQIGEELTEQGGLAMLYALFGILIYVAFRFEYRFAAGSVAALIHDVVITLGVFSLTQMQFDLTVLAAILAVIGYSLNDTIVVFDRIRENFLKLRKGTPEEVMNISVNQTLSRTLVTSGTTLMVVLSLYFLGGEVMVPFAFALLIGVLIGTYSSIFIASGLALALGVTKADLMPPEKDEDEEDLEREKP
ncbi:protein translocase subunit SecF [Alkalilimnicola ehrlichii]|uniref:Protein-export membrane protein SecF n=1 Tax=Alkalilimnicola ehrlichii TaxID=351052 RepID=A0A3E0X1C1_9GAMM|nr:protein translocase subunit SecF [Alkalilimnicola ehrlichii]RFA30495.1 protein translocase subunit SecF [Alkalilimnicola ehrlichii]RFA38045.1 protein translocase subunit SecF [Alkalilimnicola ehrlichii]